MSLIKRVPASISHCAGALRARSGAASWPMFWSDQRGVVVYIFALAKPAQLAGITAATEYSRIVSRRAQMQSAADSAAMVAAKELTLSNADNRVADVAKAAARASLAINTKATDLRIDGQVLNNRTAVQVTIVENVPFMMGHVVGWPNADVSVKAVAKLTGGKRRLCMIALETTTTTEGIRLEQYAKIQAEKCDVQSDSKSVEGIKTYNDSSLKADRICTAGGYKAAKAASFSPTPVTDCPQIGDPLAGRSAPYVGGCDYTNKVVSSSETLNPGVYCGGLKINEGGIAKLNPGEYKIVNGKLWVVNWSALYGENVGFYFKGDTAVLDIDPYTYISLTAPKSGSLAGILFFEDRSAPLARKFRIASEYARQLLGTIYLSRGMFYVGTNSPVASESAYTVVVARQVRMDAGPTLVLNSNYSGTDIPVPEGLGPTVDPSVSLSQ
jgi:Flp pilus assembly protein TadG